MELEISRLDHHGVVAGVIKDLGLIEEIDSRLGVHDQSEISHGEAIAGMILNGLGFTDRPMFLTPQFFENKPMGSLFREGVEASHFNRFKLGRSLDAAYDYSCERLFGELSVSVCRAAGVDTRFGSDDTTSFSFTGEYLEDKDTHGILITHGYSKDHRPDLKQMVLEMMVSQDGGVPLLMKCWSGNSDDNTIFRERAKQLAEAWKAAEIPPYFITDSKGYHQANAKNLKQLNFITRIPENINFAKTTIDQALKEAQWKVWDERRKYRCFEVEHYGIIQRWIVVFSKPALERARKTVEKAKDKEQEKIGKQAFHLQTENFDDETQARSALDQLVKKWKYHDLHEVSFHQQKHYLKKGRPSKDSPFEVKVQIHFKVQVNEQRIHERVEQKACFIVGTNIEVSQLEDLKVLKGYQGQDHIEKGFGFLKSPLCFASSLFVEKTSRIEGLVMVMTLALLVYSIAQRRLRKALDAVEETIPNQIKQPTKRPTLRWIFQILEGINHVVIKMGEGIRIMIDGLNEMRRKILTLMGKQVALIYQLRPQ